MMCIYSMLRNPETAKDAKKPTTKIKKIRFYVKSRDAKYKKHNKKIRK